jgi:hypothetical protein
MPCADAAKFSCARHCRFDLFKQLFCNAISPSVKSITTQSNQSSFLITALLEISSLYLPLVAGPGFAKIILKNGNPFCAFLQRNRGFQR